MAGGGRLGDDPDGWVLVVGVILSDEHEGVGGRRADHPAREEVHPRARRVLHVQHDPRGDAEPDDGEAHGDAIAAFDDLVRVLLLTPHSRVQRHPLVHGHDPRGGHEAVQGVDHEWEHDKPGGIGNLCLLGHRRAEDHGADDLGGDGLEQIRAPRAAVAHVVPDEIRDDRGVPRVILRDARLHLSHQVGTHVGGFGVDAAAELSEEGDE